MHMAAMMQMQAQLQMGALAQMQQMQMMQQIQMMQQMQPMMNMQMPTGVIPVVPVAASPAATQGAEDSSLPPLDSCTREDLVELEAEVKEMEQKAKESAKQKGAFVGYMARFLDDEGFGFISCPEC